jgi:hypothetical protein
MANGNLYGNSSMGYSYSPDRSRDVDRFNTSTSGNYTYFDPYRQGYYIPDRSKDVNGYRKPFPASDLFD